MALTGHLSDLSLSELIEFFCNQRKTGRLKVLYPKSPGYFYLQTGSVVDARIGVLRGIDAVFYALTLTNAKFEFSTSAEATDRTINQPWTQVVLEGLRRLDEGILPAEAFPVGYSAPHDEAEASQTNTISSPGHAHVPAFLSFMGKESMARRKQLIVGAVVVAILASVAVIGVPAGWYGELKATVAANSAAPELEPSEPTTEEAPKAEAPDSSSHGPDAAASVARRQRERERARAREEKTVSAAAAVNASSTSASTTAAAALAKAGPKKVVVTVTYDESGRVTQASGADATALRIARQKRFPAGKSGSTTITIPLN